MKILALGDVVGPAGVAAVTAGLRPLKRETGADLVIVNAENSYISNGLDVRSAEALFAAGADVLTGGNHSLRIHDTFSYYDDNDFVLRPINYPAAAPGKGYTLLQLANGRRVLVICAAGQVFMDPADSAFCAVDRLLEQMKGRYDVAVADFHAEATSEKAAFFHHFDGRISAMFGTHTHVQTADESLLPKGSGYISDLGMCGVTGGVLGVKPETVIPNYTSKVHHRFEKAEGEVSLCGALFTVEDGSGIVKEVLRLRKDLGVI